MILICFWSLYHADDRQCIEQLAARSGELARRGVIIVSAHAGPDSPKSVRDWAKRRGILFPIATVPGYATRKFSPFGVRWLPWLLLMDSHHVVRAEGFTLDELDVILKNISGK